MNISVLGSGSWGTAISVLLNNNGHNVKIYSRNKNTKEDINNGENRNYLPGIIIDKKIKAYDDLNYVLKKTEIIVIAIPSQNIRDLIQKISKLINLEDIIMVNLSKGIEIETGKLINQISYEINSKIKYCTISGPSHAEEVAKNIPTGVVVAGYDNDINKFIQKKFSNEFFRIYTNKDINGVEICGAVKNVYAISAGIIDGFGKWDNSKAFLITRALFEMTRLGLFYKGEKETFLGLAGTGDMMVTCNSIHSRNRKVGELIGKGYKLNDILKNMNMVAEGVFTVKALKNIIDINKINMPIAAKVYEVLYNEKDPKKAIYELMTRTLKSENI